MKKIAVLCWTTDCGWHNINDSFKTPCCFLTHCFI